jgi:hypothetical protein
MFITILIITQVSGCAVRKLRLCEEIPLSLFTTGHVLSACAGLRTMSGWMRCWISLKSARPALISSSSKSSRRPRGPPLVLVLPAAAGALLLLAQAGGRQGACHLLLLAGDLGLVCGSLQGSPTSSDRAKPSSRRKQMRSGSSSSRMRVVTQLGRRA